MICPDCGKDVAGYTAFNITTPVEHECPSRKHPWEVRAEKAEARVTQLEASLRLAACRYVDDPPARRRTDCIAGVPCAVHALVRVDVARSSEVKVEAPIVSAGVRYTLVDILSQTDRLDKITVTLDVASRDLTIAYADLDDEWCLELLGAEADPAVVRTNEASLVSPKGEPGKQRRSGECAACGNRAGYLLALVDVMSGKEKIRHEWCCCGHCESFLRGESTTHRGTAAVTRVDNPNNARCFHVEAGQPCTRYLEGAERERAEVVKYLRKHAETVIPIMAGELRRVASIVERGCRLDSPKADESPPRTS